jgi:hypothetical protein
MFRGGTQAGLRCRVVLAACALASLAAVAGCTSAGNQPSWAGALGSGVAVESPGSASAGNGSPQEVMIGVTTVFSTQHFTDLCKYEEPSHESECNPADWSPDQVDYAELPVFKNVKPGYTAIDGDKALVGFTGTVCVLKDYPSCFTNKDPAAVLDSGKSFSTLWSQSLMSTDNVYLPSPAVKINGNWYAYTVNGTVVPF